MIKTTREDPLVRVTIWMTRGEKQDWEAFARKYSSLSDLVRTAVRSFKAGLSSMSPQQSEELAAIVAEIKDIQAQNRKDAADLKFYRESAPTIAAPEDLVQRIRVLVSHGDFTTGEVAFIVNITREECILILSAMRDAVQDEQTARWRVGT